MAKPLRESSAQSEKDFPRLLRVIVKTLKKDQYLANFFQEILTDSEIRMIVNRLKIAKLLFDGNSIRQTAQKVVVGTDTVVRVSRMAKNPTFQKVLQVFKKERGLIVQKPSKKEIKKAVKKPTLGYWVFGKSEE